MVDGSGEDDMGRHSKGGGFGSSNCPDAFINPGP